MLGQLRPAPGRVGCPLSHLAHASARILMDRSKYFDITHRDHVVCNPLSVEKVDEIVCLLDLQAGARVLDIACGKAEILVRISERYECTGIGVDISPYAASDARA